MSEKIDNPIIKLESIDSTNNYATKHLIKESWAEGTVVVADVQLKGKGQQFNTWESEKGKNLLLSIVLYPSFLPVHFQFEISKVITLAVCDVISLFVENVSIKWPNDIYVGNKKIAGILIENAIIGSEFSHSIAGIGLNVNQQVFLSDAPNPVSLYQLKGIEFNREEVLNLLIHTFNKWYGMLKQKNFSEIDFAYLSRFYRLGVEAKYKDETGIFTGKIIGVNPIGQLMVEKSSGEVKKYHFKEVEFLE
jgi:BirA family transcriptional regulator, biotin operon repressor / biotin---[acetyl-CoA-carboxylase] ligase